MRNDCEFMGSEDLIVGEDGLHLSRDGHRILASKLSMKVQQILKQYNFFRNYYFANISSRCLKGACTTMKENKLLSYISMLTPEQIDKIIDRLPRLYEEVLSQAPVSPPGQSEPTS